MLHTIDDIAARDVGEVLGHHERRLWSIEQSYGLQEGGVWPDGAAPDGYAEVRQQYCQAWDSLFEQKLEALGEPEMAQLFREDRSPASVGLCPE
jgi:hypothetical protein